MRDQKCCLCQKPLQGDRHELAEGVSCDECHLKALLEDARKTSPSIGPNER